MFTDALLLLVADLTDAGLNAALDAADVSPPGVLVRPAAVLPASAKLCGDYPVRSSLFLVVPDTGTITALRGLDDLYQRLQDALRGATTRLTSDERTFERLVMPDDPTGLPALRLTALTPAPATAPATALSRRSTR